MERFSLENTDSTPFEPATSEEAEEITPEILRKTKAIVKKKRKLLDNRPDPVKEKRVKKAVKLAQEMDILTREGISKAHRAGNKEKKKELNKEFKRIKTSLNRMPESVINDANKRLKAIRVTKEQRETQKLADAKKKLASLDTPPETKSINKFDVEEKSEKDPVSREVHSSFLKAVAKGEVDGYRHAHTFLDKADELQKKADSSPDSEKAALEEQIQELVKESEAHYEKAEKDFKAAERERLTKPHTKPSEPEKTLETATPETRVEKKDGDLTFVPYKVEEHEYVQPEKGGLISRIKDAGRILMQRIKDVVTKEQIEHYEAHGLIEPEIEKELVNEVKIEQKEPQNNDVKVVNVEESREEIVTPPTEATDETPGMAQVVEGLKEYMSPAVSETKESNIGWEGDWLGDERPEGYVDVENRYKAAKRKGFKIIDALGQDFMDAHDALLNKAEDEGRLTKEEVDELLARNRQFHDAIDTFNENYNAEHPRPSKNAHKISSTSEESPIESQDVPVEIG